MAAGEIARKLPKAERDRIRACEYTSPKRGVDALLRFHDLIWVQRDKWGNAPMVALTPLGRAVAQELKKEAEPADDRGGEI